MCRPPEVTKGQLFASVQQDYQLLLLSRLLAKRGALGWQLQQQQEDGEGGSSQEQQQQQDAEGDGELAWDSQQEQEEEEEGEGGTPAR